MKPQHQKGDWYQLIVGHLVVNVYLQSITSFSEIWKWEIEFIGTDKTISDTSGWAPDLPTAQKDAIEHAELFVGKGKAGLFHKQSTVYPEIDDVV